MREAALLAVAVLAFVGSAFVPGGAFDAATHSANPEPADKTATGNFAREQPKPETLDYASWVAGTTELARAGDGHFYADAMVNNSRIHFLIDTGASVVALTGADARAAGLHWSAADVRPIARGASGPVFGVALTLDHISLNGHKANNVSAIIVPEGLDTSLLGQSYLSTVQPVRIEHDKMVLGE